MATKLSSMRKGLYRINRPIGMENDVQVGDVNGDNDMPLPESIYRERGYQPPFDELPWQEKYFSEKANR